MTELVNKRSEVALVREAARRTLKQRTMTEIKSLARTHTVHAVNTLVKIMLDKNAPAHARVSAANAILDRGWGKPLQPIANEDGKPLSSFIASSGSLYIPATVKRSTPMLRNPCSANR